MYIFYFHDILIQMKTKEKEEARKLRAQGKSVNEIAKILKVSKGSVSLWTKNIILTQDQINNLKSKIPNLNGYS